MVCTTTHTWLHKNYTFSIGPLLWSSCGTELTSTLVLVLQLLQLWEINSCCSNHSVTATGWLIIFGNYRLGNFLNWIPNIWHFGNFHFRNLGRRQSTYWERNSRPDSWQLVASLAPATKSWDFPADHKQFHKIISWRLFRQWYNKTEISRLQNQTWIETNRPRASITMRCYYISHDNSIPFHSPGLMG